MLGKDSFEGLRLVSPSAWVAHHYLEQHGTVWSGDKRAEGGTERELDMSSCRAQPITAQDLSFEDHEHVWTEMTVPALNDTGIPLGVQG